jgi:DNA-binding NarL/FixJ family response regulator
MTRYGVTQLINEQFDLIACGEAENARHGLAAVAALQPDLVLADITLPDKSGLDFTRELKHLHPNVPVLIMSMHDEMLYAERVLAAGGRGYVMKTEGGAKLLEAIRAVLLGHVYVSGRMTTTILDRLTHRVDQITQPRPGPLTDREFEVFQLLGQGLSTGQIAERLHLSVKTVGVHRIHIKSKLGLRSGPELIRQAVQWGATQQLF